MKKNQKQIDYSANYRMLMDHISSIENEEISLDELAEKVKSALSLIDVCEQALRNIEKELPKG